MSNLNLTRWANSSQYTAPEDKKLEKLIWNAYLEIEAYLRLREPFSFYQEFLRRSDGDHALKSIPPLQLPPNTPPEYVQNAWQSVLQQAMANLSGQSHEVDFEIVNCLIESIRIASEFRTTGKLQLVRNQNGLMDVTHVVTDYGWKEIGGDIS